MFGETTSSLGDAKLHIWAVLFISYLPMYHGQRKFSEHILLRVPRGQWVPKGPWVPRALVPMGEWVPMGQWVLRAHPGIPWVTPMGHPHGIPWVSPHGIPWAPTLGSHGNPPGAPGPQFVSIYINFIELYIQLYHFL